MLIKDREAYQWRRAHAIEIEEQVKGFVDRALIRSGSEKSRSSRLVPLMVLCGWRRKLPYEIAKDEEVRRDPYDFIQQFVNYLVQVRISPSAVNDYVSCAKRWLVSKDVEINEYKFREKVTLPRKKKITQDKTPTPEEMKLLLEHSDLRGRTLISMIASSGMRIGELMNLKIEDIDFNIRPTAIHLWSSDTKTDEERWTFISDEATEFLKLYIKDRKSGFVFLGRHQGVRPDGTTYLRGEISEDEPMSYANVDCIFTSALERAGLRKLDKNGRDVYHFHKLRYFFKSYIGPHLDSQYVEAFMGHGNGSMKHLYDELPLPELAKIYEKGMHAVTILKRTDTKQLRELQDELEVSKKATDTILDHDRKKVFQLEEKLAERDGQIAYLVNELKAQRERLDRIERSAAAQSAPLA